jgi:long-subunit acyl-CoA synthetase (AMP-forming)
MRDARAEREAIEHAVKGQTVCSLFQQTAAHAGDLAALKSKTGTGWHSLSWRQYAEQVRDFANGLIALGLQPGESVNILGANRPEYYVTDLAILHAGGTPVSLYNSLALEQTEYIVNHCEAAYAVVENKAFYEKLRAVRPQIEHVRRVIMMEDGANTLDPWVLSFESVLGLGRDFAHSHPAEFERRWRAVQPDALATLIYTSGTTGPPKGVMVSHYNVVWTAESLHQIMPRDPGTRHISYLPMAHIAERMAGHYLQIRGASTCYFCPSPQDIAQYMTDVRPEFFFAVPRIWEKLHNGLVTAIANTADEAQGALVTTAIAACLERVRLEQRRAPVPADLQARAQQAQAVMAALRQRVGLDAVKLASTGAAPIAPQILEWFQAIGVPILEVYGQSEDTGPTSWNRVGASKIGTVGPPLPGVEVRLADDGELLVRGGNVTGGYYKEPALTAETFDADGWLHSGDVAEIDGDGFIKIVDRKKEIIITAGGKNIAPSNIENLLKQKPLIGQACVIGDRRPFVSAVVVLDPDNALPWARQHRLPTELGQLAGHPTVLAEIQRYIDEINQHLNNVERVKKFTVLAEEWTPDSGELTPTLKMKRKVVNEKYGDVIEKMYQ